MDWPPHPMPPMLVFDERILTPGAVRREAIRVVRHAAMWPEPRVGPVPDASRRGLVDVIAGAWHDLKLSLAAISHSLADGVEYASGEGMRMRPRPTDRTRLETAEAVSTWPMG